MNKNHKQHEKDQEDDDQVLRMPSTIVEHDDNGNIFFKGVITGEATHQFHKILRKFQMDNNVDVICLYLSSPGGDATSSLFMHDIIKMSPKPVGIFICEMAASGGTIVMCAGTHVVCHESSLFMIHEIIASFMGDLRQSEMRTEQDAQKILMDRILSIYNERTKKKNKAITAKDLEKDFYFNATDALKMGFVDEIIRPSAGPASKPTKKKTKKRKPTKKNRN